MSKKRNLMSVQRQIRIDPSAPVGVTISATNFVSGRTRSQWYLSLGVQVYLLVTLIAVEDADFFVVARSTDLPVLGVSVPTASFFVFAALLCFALYVSLHIHLQRLWTEVVKLMAQNHVLLDQVQPWIVIDMLKISYGSKEVKSRQMSRVVQLFAICGIWLFTPSLLIAFWWRYMTSHNTPNSLLLGLLVTLSVNVALTSWRSFRRLKLEKRQPPRAFTFTALFVLLLCLSSSISLGRTSHSTTFLWSEDGPSITVPSLTIYRSPPDDHILREGLQEAYEQQSEFKRFIADNVPFVAKIYGLAPINLRGVELVERPTDWLPSSIARRSSTEEICDALGYDADRCDLVDWLGGELSDKQVNDRMNWCSEKDIEVNCLASFEWQDDWARSTWGGMRARARLALPNLDLRNADLRGADLTGAFLVGADLTGARLDFAVLNGADFEGANLEDAVLSSVSAWRTNFQWVNGWRSNWIYAVLYGADLSSGRLRGVNFFRADFWHVEITDADLWGASFRESKLRSVDFSRSKFWGGTWQGTSVEGVRLFGTDLSYVSGLTQMMLNSTIGDGSTVLTTRDQWDPRPNHRIAECWKDVPASVAQVPARPGIVRFGYVAPVDWICSGSEQVWHEATRPFAEQMIDRVIPGQVEVRIYGDDQLRPFGPTYWDREYR